MNLVSTIEDFLDTNYADEQIHKSIDLLFSVLTDEEILKFLDDFLEDDLKTELAYRYHVEDE
jgi:hypothetical protein